MGDRQQLDPEVLRQVLSRDEQQLLLRHSQGKSLRALAQLYRQYEGENGVQEALDRIKEKIARARQAPSSAEAAVTALAQASETEDDPAGGMPIRRVPAGTLAQPRPRPVDRKAAQPVLDAILRVVTRKGAPMRRSDIEEALPFSKSSVTRGINQLAESGHLVETGRGTTPSGGPPAPLWGLPEWGSEPPAADEAAPPTVGNTICELLQEDGPAVANTLIEATGRPASSILNELSALVKAERVVVLGKEGRARVYGVPGQEWAPPAPAPEPAESPEPAASDLPEAETGGDREPRMRPAPSDRCEGEAAPSQPRDSRPPGHGHPDDPAPQVLLPERIPQPVPAPEFLPYFDPAAPTLSGLQLRYIECLVIEVEGHVQGEGSPPAALLDRVERLLWPPQQDAHPPLPAAEV